MFLYLIHIGKVHIPNVTPQEAKDFMDYYVKFNIDSEGLDPIWVFNDATNQDVAVDLRAVNLVSKVNL